MDLLLKLRFNQGHNACPPLQDLMEKPSGKKVHIGRKNEFCPTLLVHDTIMPEVASDTYLGDVMYVREA